MLNPQHVLHKQEARVFFQTAVVPPQNKRHCVHSAVNRTFFKSGAPAAQQDAVGGNRPKMSAAKTHKPRLNNLELKCLCGELKQPA